MEKRTFQRIIIKTLTGIREDTILIRKVAIKRKNTRKSSGELQIG